MVVTREAIAKLIPHEGPMSLLEGVVRWDADSIRCVARNHADPRNPLRSNGRLPVLCGVEYAAQAMAVHGGLSGVLAHRPRLGYLASLRDVSCLVERLDDLEGDLIVDAEKVAASDVTVLYRFMVEVGAVRALQGSATVLLEAA